MGLEKIGFSRKIGKHIAIRSLYFSTHCGLNKVYALIQKFRLKSSGLGIQMSTVTALGVGLDLYEIDQLEVILSNEVVGPQMHFLVLGSL